MVRTVTTTETHTDAEQNVLFKLTPTHHTHGYLLCNMDPLREQRTLVGASFVICCYVSLVGVRVL